MLYYSISYYNSIIWCIIYDPVLCREAPGEVAAVAPYYHCCSYNISVHVCVYIYIYIYVYIYIYIFRERER